MDNMTCLPAAILRATAGVLEVPLLRLSEACGVGNMAFRTAVASPSPLVGDAPLRL